MLINVLQTYGNMSDGELQLIRQSLMSFFQDMHVRVSHGCLGSESWSLGVSVVAVVVAIIFFDSMQSNKLALG